MLERIAKQRAGALLVLKVDSDQNPRASASHRIQGIPAFVLFRNGAEAGRQVGLLPEPAFDRWVGQAVAS